MGEGRNSTNGSGTGSKGEESRLGKGLSLRTSGGDIFNKKEEKKGDEED